MSNTKKGPPKKKRRPGPLCLDQEKFKALVEKHAQTLEDLLQEVNAGHFSTNEWVFTLDELITISERVAIGFWHNCRTTDNPHGKWNVEHGRYMVTKIINDAYAYRNAS